MDAAETALRALDPRFRDVLAVLAINDEASLSRSQWQEAARDAGLRDAAGRVIHGPAFKDAIGALAAAGAVRLLARGEHALVPGWLAATIDDARRRGSLASLAGDAGETAFGFGAAVRPELLLGLASADRDALARALARHDLRRRIQKDPTRLVDLLGLEIPRTWIEQLGADRRLEYLDEACVRAIDQGARLGDAAIAAARDAAAPDLRARAAIVLALRGDLGAAEEIAGGAGASQWARGARGMIALAGGQHAEARALFDEAALGSRGQRVPLPGVLAVFDILLAVTSERAEIAADVRRRLEKARRPLLSFLGAHLALERLETFRRTGVVAPGKGQAGGSWVDVLVDALSTIWMGVAIRDRSDLAERAREAWENGYRWLATELDGLAANEPRGSLRSLFAPKPGWELALEALAEAAAAEPSTASRPEGTLWWTLTLGPTADGVDLEAFLVNKPPAAKGKRVSWERLENGEVPLDDDDRRVVHAAAARAATYIGLSTSIVLALVGHPRVRDPLGRPLRVVRAVPKLRVEATAVGAIVRLHPGRFGSSGVGVALGADGRVEVSVLTPAIERIRSTLPPGGLQVPRAGLGRLSQTLTAISGAIAVEAAEALAARTVAGDPRIHAQMFRRGDAVRARLRVVPAPAAAALRPGVPPVETVVQAEGELVRVVRDLDAERAALEDLLVRAPTLASLPRDGDDLIASDLGSCLEMLVELGEVGQDVVVEWLEGQPIKAPPLRRAAQVKLRVAGDKTWLALEGEVQIDEDRVLEMRALLAGASRAVGRFVPIGDDEYLALTEELFAKLSSLGRLVSLSVDGRLTAALLPAIDGLFDGLQVSFSEELAAKRDALERARGLEPTIPRGLEAELRDYQRDGFRFLVRLAEAGLGACLADDMGLGKTVQALALLLHRRRKGPALVVAPMSVVRNWEDEARRFAPSLAIRRLASGDRAACVAEATSGDVVLASYGLLASEHDLLASRRWATVIYDEAHALKNAGTQRWSAASAIDADASVALTGTPVENHAAELHALFDLLVPGMLGSRARFQATFGRAIAEGSREAAALLRSLVRPFVLRRTKGQVLAELPPKTESVRVVPATAEHRSFYEAVRRRAVEMVDVARDASGPRAGRARFELLAELVRLRRAAIDPRLVGGEDAPVGPKIDALVEIVLELREEGRRALVFSQFLEVLDLAAAALAEREVEARRLDGGMSAAARAEEIAAFQGGLGDVFLMSLKAGGVGLNLTAADVVILLDPWWNPAVEDQAAARAHRLGQVRPVMVVRIITEATIEEKMLRLHEKKRRLYEDVVSEADGGGAVDLEAIAALVGEP